MSRHKSDERTAVYLRILHAVSRLSSPSGLTGGSTQQHVKIKGGEEVDLVNDREGVSFTNDAERDISVAYLGGQEFELSLLALSHDVNIRPDKLCGLLWGMQCRGVSTSFCYT